MPFTFVGSAAAAAGGVAMMTTLPAEAAPAARTALAGVACEFAGSQALKRRIGMVGEADEQGSAGTLMKVAEVLSIVGVVTTLFGRRSSRSRHAPDSGSSRPVEQARLIRNTWSCPSESDSITPKGPDNRKLPIYRR